ncbi:hypothetical protein [Streptomyces aureocirculatus]|uniref:hypothetical protein n=1 Tax=Streptomyces aureocirculatus TaxID=67275 RepID=UPI000AC40971|nr:hypothetical protein [Streptomyces aureocirculatus]
MTYRTRMRRSPHAGPAVPAVRSLLAVLAVCVLLLGAVTGCGISPSGPVRAGAPASGVQKPGTDRHYVRLYFAGPYGIRAVSRPADEALGPQRALELLLKGPTRAERERGLVSQVPPMGGELTAAVSEGAVDVSVPVAVNTGELDVTAVSQIACTAAHARVPGGRAATEVDIRIHENNIRSERPWTIRCNRNGNAVPAG